jgi:hypothetical protein
MHIWHRLVAPTAISVLAAGKLAAQAPPAPAQADSGQFVIRHGSDTVAVEQFSRTATSLNGTLAIRNARSTAQSYEVVVGPDASVAAIEVTVREGGDTAQRKPRVVQRARVIFKDDSVSVDDISNHGLQTRLFGTERGAVPYLNLSFALLEQAVRHPHAGTGPYRVPLFNLGGGQTVEGKVTSLGGDSLSLAIGQIEFHLRVDPSGRVLGGRIPSQQVVAERVGS